MTTILMLVVLFTLKSTLVSSYSDDYTQQSYLFAPAGLLIRYDGRLNANREKFMINLKFDLKSVGRLLTRVNDEVRIPELPMDKAYIELPMDKKTGEPIYYNAAKSFAEGYTPRNFCRYLLRKYHIKLTLDQCINKYSDEIQSDFTSKPIDLYNCRVYRQVIRNYEFTNLYNLEKAWYLNLTLEEYRLSWIETKDEYHGEYVKLMDDLRSQLPNYETIANETSTRKKRGIILPIIAMGSFGINALDAVFNFRHRRKVKKVLKTVVENQEKFKTSMVKMSRKLQAFQEITNNNFNAITNAVNALKQDMERQHVYLIGKLEHVTKQSVMLSQTMFKMRQMESWLERFCRREITTMERDYKRLITTLKEVRRSMILADQGFIPEELVTPSMLLDLLEQIDTSLSIRNEFELLLGTKTRNYYRTKIAVSLYLDGIYYIMIEVPLKSLRQDLFNLYHLESVPVPVDTTGKHMKSAYTKIELDYTYIAYSNEKVILLTDSSHKHLTRYDNYGKLYTPEHSLVQMRIAAKYCEIGIIKQNIQWVNELCRFKLYQKAPPTAIMRIGNEYLITASPTEVTLTCLNEKPTVHTIPSYFIIQEDTLCECTLSSIHIHIARQHSMCQRGDRNFHVDYVVNMAMVYFISKELREPVPVVDSVYGQIQSMPISDENFDLMKYIPKNEILELKEIELNFNETIPKVEVLDVEEMFTSSNAEYAVMFIGAILSGICFILVIVLCYRNGKTKGVIASILARPAVVRAYEMKTDIDQESCLHILDIINIAIVIGVVYLILNKVCEMLMGMYVDYSLYNRIIGLNRHNEYHKKMDIFLEITTKKGQQSIYLASFKGIFCDVLIEYFVEFPSINVTGEWFSGILTLSEPLFLTIDRETGPIELPRSMTLSIKNYRVLNKILIDRSPKCRIMLRHGYFILPLTGNRLRAIPGTEHQHQMTTLATGNLNIPAETAPGEYPILPRSGDL